MNQSPRPHWLKSALISQIFQLARACGGEARVVGGAVRDWYVDQLWAEDPDWQRPKASSDAAQPPDMDMAVSLDIGSFAKQARLAGLTVYETGLAHGTVTVRNGQEKIEVTQLRVDEKTDGRHARILPTSSWRVDAQRRDFTINALYLDEDGLLFDPAGGVADLKGRRLRFIGVAQDRLDEDYLRLLRAMRFLAQYPQLVIGDGDLAAIAKAVPCLRHLSAERIASECRKIFDGPNALSVIAMLQELQIDKTLFETGFCLIRAEAEKIAPVWPLLSFAERLALLFLPGQREKAALRLKLSRAEIRYLCYLDQPCIEEMAVDLTGTGWKKAAYRLRHGALFAYAQAGMHNSGGISLTRMRHIAGFQLPVCPVKGRDIIRHFGIEGQAVGICLARIEQIWIDSDFSLSRTQLLAAGEKLDDKQ